MAGPNHKVILFKAVCVKAEGNDLLFAADAQDVAYFHAGKEYALHATELPDGSDHPDAGDSPAESSGT